MDMEEKEVLYGEYGSGLKSSIVPPVLELIKQHDEHHPVHWPASKKWVITLIYCLLQVFVTITSTSYVSVEFLIAEKYGGSTQVITLGQSMFIVGNAVGPAFLGPLSDIGGRKWIYVGSIFVFALLNIVGYVLEYSHIVKTPVGWRHKFQSVPQFSWNTSLALNTLLSSSPRIACYIDRKTGYCPRVKPPDAHCLPIPMRCSG